MKHAARLVPIAVALSLLVVLPALTGCGKKEDPILALSSAEALQIGKDLFAKEKWSRARRYLSHAFETEPNSAGGREALLMVADTFYLQGGEENYIQAEAKYRDFLARFPTSDRAPYVQYQIGNSLARRTERADRDQTVTRKALQAYEELLVLYPTSEYAALAREQIQVVKDQLAEHEFVVGAFYLRYGIPVAAVHRFEGLLADFPDYSQREKLYYQLTVAYHRNKEPEKAGETLHRLEREFPNSEFLRKIPDRIRKAIEQAKTAKAEADEEKGIEAAAGHPEQPDSGQGGGSGPG